MLVAGVGTMLGVGTVSYLGLAVYLLWLLCSGSLASWFAVRAPAGCSPAQSGQLSSGVPAQRRRGGRLGSPREVVSLCSSSDELRCAAACRAWDGSHR